MHMQNGYAGNKHVVENNNKKVIMDFGFCGRFYCLKIISLHSQSASECCFVVQTFLIMFNGLYDGTEHLRFTRALAFLCIKCPDQRF